jgi:glutathione S-transferase
MITVHHLNNSRSQRILWLLEELGLDYEVIRYERDKKTMLAPPELRKIHPLGKSPVITDGAKTIAESGAIVEYLIETYGKGRLQGTDPISYRYWLHFAEGSAMGPLLLSLIFHKIETGPAPFFIKPLLKAIFTKVRSLVVTPNLKAKTPWFAGKEFSAADIQMSFPMEAGSSRAAKWMGPKSKAYLEKIHARPAYKKALQRGGEYTIMN